VKKMRLVKTLTNLKKKDIKTPQRELFTVLSKTWRPVLSYTA
jgi:hypothetical protein